MTKTVTIRMDESTYKTIKTAAESERRAISNFMEFATLAYVESSSFVDDEEMDGIMGNKEFMDTLRNGMIDIKNGDYRIVE